jgi:hypothetical protein
MAFTYDIGTNRGKVRFRIADTKEGTYAFEDAEIDALLTEHGSVAGAALACARFLLMDRARRARRFSDTQGDVDETATLASLQALVERLEAEAGPASLSRAVLRTRAEPDWSPQSETP